jgi:hypothetical protein
VSGGQDARRERPATGHRQHRALQQADRSPHRSRDGGFLELELSEWLPGPREPAYDAKRSHEGEAPAAFE